MSLNRVADRVRKGGHNIPEQVVRRRYVGGIKNLFMVYRPILDSWTLFDNSPPNAYTTAKETDGHLRVLDRFLFEQFSKMAHESDNENLQESPDMPDWAPALHALHLAVAEVIEEHLKTGHPLIVWRDGKVYRQPPEEARREMEQALKNDPWAAQIEALRRQRARKLG